MQATTADLLGAVIYLIRVIPERDARRVLLSAQPFPTDANDLAEWLKLNFKHLPISDPLLWDKALELLDENHRRGVTPLGLASPEYPALLKLIADPPPLLFVKGNLSALSAKSVAVVGTRDASQTGLEVARRVSLMLGQNQWNVVSGLALGIDAAAHEGALLGPSQTVAVLANGLHEAMPRKNALLAERILLADGAWVSEHSVGVKPRKEYFVFRNRIQIGLSAGSIIVEAALRSGSMAQANYCIAEKRPLFAVTPEQPTNSLGLHCEGTLDMVQRLGAISISTRNDYPKVLEVISKSYQALSGQVSKAPTK